MTGREQARASPRERAYAARVLGERSQGAHSESAQRERAWRAHATSARGAGSQRTLAAKARKSRARIACAKCARAPQMSRPSQSRRVGARVERAASARRGYARVAQTHRPPLLFPDFITRPLSRIVGGAVRRRVDARDGQPDAAADARARGLLHGGDRQGATPRSCHATPRCVAPWCHVQRASSQRRSASHDAARCRVAREYRCHPRGVVVHLRETLTARWQRAKMNRVFREVL